MIWWILGYVAVVVFAVAGGRWLRRLDDAMRRQKRDPVKEKRT